MLNLPLALIGGVFALVITTGEVSIPAIIGFIALFGIATRNGMLLISHYNHRQKEEGLNVYDSVMQGSLDRLNPILMTCLLYTSRFFFKFGGYLASRWYLHSPPSGRRGG